jgi:hypothetical protein
MLDTPEQGTAPSVAPASTDDSSRDVILLDQYAAAFCLTRGHRITHTSMGGTRTQFHFPPDAASDVRAYHAGDLVSAKVFASAVRWMKAATFHPELVLRQDERSVR